MNTIFPLLVKQFSRNPFATSLNIFLDEPITKSFSVNISIGLLRPSALDFFPASKAFDIETA